MVNKIDQSTIKSIPNNHHYLEDFNAVFNG